MMYKQLLGWASLLFSAVLSAPLFADSAPAVGINMLAEPAHPQHFERQFRGTVTRVPLSPNVAYPDDAYDIFNQDYGQSFTQRFVARQRNAACNAGAFVSSGDALLNQIKTQGFECVGELFNTASDTIKTGTFTQANILTVTAEAKRLATAYQGTDSGDYLNSLYYWVRAFYFYNNRALMNSANQDATADAIKELFENAHFLDRTKENAAVVEGASVLILNALIGDRFVPTLKLLLSRYDQNYDLIRDWNAAFTNFVWQVLNRCARVQGCRSAEHNSDLAIRLGDYIHGNIAWLNRADHDHHLHNLGYQLGNFYSGSGDAQFSTVKAELDAQMNKILNAFGPLPGDVGRNAYLAVLSAINFHGQCAAFGLCDKKQELIDKVLDDRITCPSGTLFMWAQDMNQAQLEWACTSLVAHENHFHTTMQTNRTPVTPDDNDKLRMVVFNDSSEWRAYGYLLFGASTDNGGLYLEGDPSQPGDQATFFAYEDVGARPIFDIWNLRHEYIHYLDGRFIKFGDFGLNNGTGRTVWYGEGIAEYISRRTCNANAESEAKKGSYPISTIFKNEYGVGQTRIYPWGYLAVRYMFEQQNATFFQMLEKFKKGEYPSYRTDMVDPWVSNKTYDGNFAAWLPNVASSGCVVDDTRPPSPLPPVDIDDVQGDDKPGFDACAAGRTPITGGELKAGVASCLADVSDSRQTQMSIHIDGVDADLEITLRHGSGNGDLYHRFDRRPTPAVNDHASAGPGNTEDIMVKSLKQGWNYIHVIANPSFSGATVLARFVEKSTPGQNKSPKALANGPYKGNVGQAIAFSSGGSNDVDGTITGYLWNFGDGNSSSVANPSHSYSKVGNYSVTLTVTDDKGATDNSVASVAVSAASTGNVVPIAEANGPYSSVVGNAISFSSGGSSDSDGSIASYNWNFGDGNSSTAANPSHSYASAGSYTVTLAVTDDKGATANDTATATVTAQPTPPPPANALPTAEANGPYSGTAGNAVSFSSSGSVDSDGSIAGYSWSFGDGSSSSAANPSHSYASAGTYTVTLTVTDDKGATASDTAQATITTASADGGGATNGGTVTTVSSSESGGSSASSPLLLSLLILVTTLLRRRMTG